MQLSRIVPVMADAGWCALFCNPASEQAVAARLRREGWRAYLPLYRKLLRGVIIKGGRRVRTKGAGEIVFRPLFTRYLFVEIDLETQAWTPLARCHGVDRLVLASREIGSRPGLIADEVIELIRQAVDAGDFDDHVARPKAVREDLRKLLAAGEQPQVRINGFDLVGRLQSLDENGRAAVLIELLGRPIITRTEAAPLVLVAD